MIQYLLDTSVLVEFLNGNESIKSHINGLDGELSTSFTCVAELYEGIFLVRNPQEAELKLLDLCSGLGQIYGLDYEISKLFGDIRANLRKKGQIIEDLDILIAATCLAHRLSLATLNPRHFSRIPGLKIHSFS